MDFLNKYFTQIRELFEGMTPGARVTSALLLAVTVASLGYLFTSGFNPGGDVYLLDNQAFTGDELRPMLAAFATEGLAAPEIDGGKIRVSRGKQTPTWRLSQKPERCRRISARFWTALSRIVARSKTRRSSRLVNKMPNSSSSPK